MTRSHFIPLADLELTIDQPRFDFVAVVPPQPSIAEITSMQQHAWLLCDILKLVSWGLVSLLSGEEHFLFL